MASLELPKPSYAPGTKTFVPLENNPRVMTSLAHTLGLKNNLNFHDVYSLTDTELLSFVPRPALALLVIIPLTPSWRASRIEEDASCHNYSGNGLTEPVLWFKQTIRHACGLIGLLHCLSNLPDGYANAITPGSLLDRLTRAAIPLDPTARAQLLYDSAELEAAHQSHAQEGQSAPPEDADAFDETLHFVAFVKGRDGQLWELEGGRKGPVQRGVLEEGEDVLSQRAYELGMGRILELQEEEADVRFSAIVLAPETDDV